MEIGDAVCLRDRVISVNLGFEIVDPIFKCQWVIVELGNLGGNLMQASELLASAVEI